MDKRRFDEDITRLPDWDAPLQMKEDGTHVESVFDKFKSTFSINKSAHDPNKSIEFTFDGELRISIESNTEGIGMEVTLNASETSFILEFAEACRNLLNKYGY